jgi:hypothetical protein
VGAADAANNEQEGAPAAKRQRLRRLRKAQPEPATSVLPSSPVQDVPSRSVRVNDATADGAATQKSGETSGDAGSDEGARTSAKDQEEEEEVDWPGDDSSPTVVLDMVFWGAGLGRLQVCMALMHCVSWQCSSGGTCQTRLANLYETADKLPLECLLQCGSVSCEPHVTKLCLCS